MRLKQVSGLEGSSSSGTDGSASSERCALALACEAVKAQVGVLQGSVAHKTRLCLPAWPQCVL